MQNNESPEKKVIYIHSENSHEPMITDPHGEGLISMSEFKGRYLGLLSDEEAREIREREQKEREHNEKTNKLELSNKKGERYSSRFVRFLERILPKSWFLWLERKIRFKKEVVFLDLSSLSPEERDRRIYESAYVVREAPRDISYDDNKQK